MRKAIETRYVGPTNQRGSRVIAQCAAGSVSVPYDYALNEDQMHALAALALAKRLEWPGLWIGGASRNGRGNVFVGVGAAPLAMRWPDEFGARGADWFFVEDREA